jgi:hypothetical protein
MGSRLKAEKPQIHSKKAKRETERKIDTQTSDIQRGVSDGSRHPFNQS